jgi:hypothetical protein
MRKVRKWISKKECPQPSFWITAVLLIAKLETLLSTKGAWFILAQD